MEYYECRLAKEFLVTLYVYRNRNVIYIKIFYKYSVTIIVRNPVYGPEKSIGRLNRLPLLMGRIALRIGIAPTEKGA